MFHAGLVLVNVDNFLPFAEMNCELFFVLIFASLSVRSKVFLLETEDVPPENKRLDSTGIS